MRGLLVGPPKLRPAIMAVLAILLAVPSSPLAQSSNAAHANSTATTSHNSDPSPEADREALDGIDLAWLTAEVTITLDRNQVTEVRDWNGRTETITYHAPSLDLPISCPEWLPSWLRWAWRAWLWLRQPWEVNYPHQWFWDSCAAAMVLSHLDTAKAETEIEGLLYAQREDGFLPHMVWNDNRLTWAAWLLRLLYPSVHTSPYLHPPSLAEAVLKVYEQSGDIAFVQRVLPPVRKYYQHVEEARVLGEDGLPVIIHSFESSKDRSPEYDQVYGESNAGFALLGPMAKLLFKHWSVGWDLDSILAEKWFQVKDTLFCSIYARNLSALARLSEIAGKPEDAAHFRAMAGAVGDSILAQMYDPLTGLFYSLDSHGPEDRQIKVNTISSLMPLILDNLPEEQVERLVNEHLLNPEEYWLEYPVPVEPATTASPVTDEHVIWRGAQTWMYTNWYIVQGLRKQAQRFPEHSEKYERIADTIVLRSYELVRRHGFREYYDAYTGEGLRAEQFGWTTLILDML